MTVIRFGGAVLCAMACVLPASIAAQEIAPETLESAAASILANHPEGCVLFNLDATQARRQGRIAQRFLTVSVFRDSNGVNCSSGPGLQLFAVGEVEKFDFSISPQLTDATLRAVVPAKVTSGTPIVFTLDIRWSGIGLQPYPLRDRQLLADTVAHRHGHQRPASVVVVVSDGGRDYLANAFFSEGSLSVATVFQSAR